MVPLAEAWDSGARSWTSDRREAYANDLGAPATLVGVTASLNRSKGDQDVAEWLPPINVCRYLKDWVTAKVRWGLSQDSGEKSALSERRVVVHRLRDHGDGGGLRPAAEPRPGAVRCQDMQCPTDGAVLVMSERSGIEIDYCPTCRGVWLDRGELDKIIDRSLTEPMAAPPAPGRARSPGAVPRRPRDDRRDDRRDEYRDDRGDYRGGYQQQGHYKKKRKESWLSELFD